MNKTANKYFDIWKVVSIVILCLYGLFLLYPLFKLLYNAFFYNGEFTTQYFQNFFAQNYYVRSIFNSLKVISRVK